MSRSARLPIETILWCWTRTIALLVCKRTARKSAYSHQMDQAKPAGERSSQSVRPGSRCPTDTGFPRRFHDGHLASRRRPPLDGRFHHFKWLSLPLASMVSRREYSAAFCFHLEPLGHAGQRRSTLLVLPPASFELRLASVRLQLLSTESHRKPYPIGLHPIG